ncbi:MAG: hypothetical protein ACMZ64_06945 [Oleiphilus sp.]
MDVDQVHNNVEEKKNCYEGWVAFNRASGMRSSAYEHQIPEQLFSTDTEQAEGVSTAKALALAMAQGQRIYTLTSENASELNNISIDEGARAEVQQALVQGMEVTVHQAPINVNGWEGSGYSVLDPELGVGAYQISGGASGGVLFALGTTMGALFSISIMLGPDILSSPIAGQTLIATALLATAITSFAIGLIVLATDKQGAIASFMAGFSSSIAILGIGEAAQSSKLSRSGKAAAIGGIISLVYTFINEAIG